MLGSIITELLTQLYAVKQRGLRIVETGTMYYTKLEPGEVDLRERSTMAITTWIEKNQASMSSPHSFVSIDSSGEHILECQRALGDLSRNVLHLRDTGTHGLLVAALSEPFDLALLDADSDGEATAQEFYIVHRHMAPDGIVVIDDAFKHPSVNKARVIIESRCFPYVALRNQAIGIAYGDAARKILQEFK